LPLVTTGKKEDKIKSNSIKPTEKQPDAKQANDEMTRKIKRADYSSESSYFSDASNSDYDEHLIIPDASSSDDDSDIDDIIIKPSEPPPQSTAQTNTKEPIVEQDEIVVVVVEEEVEPIVIEDIESIDDRTDDCDNSVNSSKDDSLTTQSRLEQWETKLKEEKSNSLQRRLERKSLDLLGSLDDKKKNLFETFDDRNQQQQRHSLERPATVATVSLGKLGF